MQGSIVREVKIERTPRVLQVESMFDVPPGEVSRVEWSVDLTSLSEKPWQVGLIVGPSGSGKSTIAQDVFGDKLITGFDWPRDKAIVDAFPDKSIKDITGWLTSVGFSSPPNWLRPYHVLSNGEKFRADIARALAQGESPIVFDEFTSVVDRQVAQVASHSVQKAVRRSGRQFVAVTCHYDILDWLQPDWVFQPQENALQWRSQRRRPTVDLEIYPIGKAAWSLFKKYHYMSGDLHFNAKCFGGFVNGECVAFTSYLYFPHPKTKNIMMGHRLVVHPDWQGLGIGGRLDDWLGQYLYDRGYRYHNVVAHPAMIAYYKKSPRWKMTRASSTMAKGGSKAQRGKLFKNMAAHNAKVSASRFTYSFEYVPPEKEGETE